MDGFFLGLANGITCVAACAPVMLPLFLGEGRQVKQNGWLLAQFLLGRLAGYLLFGALAWLAGRLIFQNAGPSGMISGAVYVSMGGLLLFYGLGEFIRTPGAAIGPKSAGLARPGQHLGCPVPPGQVRRWLRFTPVLFPLALGFLTGLNLCLPFIAAFTGASAQASLPASMLFFAAFFAGTAVFFLPFPFVGAFRRAQGLRTIGKFAAIFVALYYLYTGMFTLMGGLIS